MTVTYIQSKLDDLFKAEMQLLRESTEIVEMATGSKLSIEFQLDDI